MKSAVSGSKKTVEEKAPAKSDTGAGAAAGGIPSIEDPAFEKWVETDAFTKLLENEIQLTAVLEKAAK